MKKERKYPKRQREVPGAIPVLPEQVRKEQPKVELERKARRTKVVGRDRRATVTRSWRTWAEEMFEHWLVDGESWIGVFENKDLGHREVGRKVAFAFALKDWDRAVTESEVGGTITVATPAPDHRSIGMGWRYVLVAKCRTVDEAVKAMTRGAE